MTAPALSDRARLHAAKLRRLWADPDLTTTAIGRELGISQPTVSRWVRLLGLPTRKRGETFTDLPPRGPTPELYRCPSCGGRSRTPVHESCAVSASGEGEA